MDLRTPRARKASAYATAPGLMADLCLRALIDSPARMCTTTAAREQKKEKPVWQGDVSTKPVPGTRDRMPCINGPVALDEQHDRRDDSGAKCTSDTGRHDRAEPPEERLE
jgi:hypothetical protein